jgi:hypothetical protein
VSRKFAHETAHFLVFFLFFSPLPLSNVRYFSRVVLPAYVRPVLAICHSSLRVQPRGYVGRGPDGKKDDRLPQDLFEKGSVSRPSRRRADQSWALSELTIFPVPFFFPLCYSNIVTYMWTFFLFRFTVVHKVPDDRTQPIACCVEGVDRFQAAV